MRFIAAGLGVLGVAQHREQSPHVAQRRGVGLLDRVECPSYLALVVAEGASGATGARVDRVSGSGSMIACPRWAGDHRAPGTLLLVGLQDLVVGGEPQGMAAAESDRQPRVLGHRCAHLPREAPALERPVDVLTYLVCRDLDLPLVEGSVR